MPDGNLIQFPATEEPIFVELQNAYAAQQTELNEKYVELAAKAGLSVHSDDGQPLRAVDIWWKYIVDNDVLPRRNGLKAV